MSKEELIKLGLTEEQAVKVLSDFDKIELDGENLIGLEE